MCYTFIAGPDFKDVCMSASSVLGQLRSQTAFPVYFANASKCSSRKERSCFGWILVLLSSLPASATIVIAHVVVEGHKRGGDGS